VHCIVISTDIKVRRFRDGPVKLRNGPVKKIFKIFIANGGKAGRSIILMYECTAEVYGGKTVEIKTFLTQMLLTIVGSYLQPAYPFKRYDPLEKETSVQKWKPRIEHGGLCIRPPPLREAA
jgi:hypothetical protein